MKLKTLFFGQRETFLAGIENPLQPLSTMSGSVDPLVYQLPLRPAQLPSPEKIHLATLLITPKPLYGHTMLRALRLLLGESRAAVHPSPFLCTILAPRYSLLP